MLQISCLLRFAKVPVVLTATYISNVLSFFLANNNKYLVYAYLAI